MSNFTTTISTEDLARAVIHYAICRNCGGRLFERGRSVACETGCFTLVLPPKDRAEAKEGP